MAFEDLPITLQNILIFQHESFSKLFVLFFVLVLALAYIFHFSREMKSTPFMFVGILRLLTTMMSWIYFVFFLPLLIMFSSPKLPLDSMFSYLMIAYTIILVLSLIVLFLNSLYFGGMWILHLMKIDDGNTNVMKFKKWQNNVAWEMNGRNN